MVHELKGGNKEQTDEFVWLRFATWLGWGLYILLPRSRRYELSLLMKRKTSENKVTVDVGRWVHHEQRWLLCNHLVSMSMPNRRLYCQSICFSRWNLFEGLDDRHILIIERWSITPHLEVIDGRLFLNCPQVNVDASHSKITLTTCAEVAMPTFESMSNVV